MNDRKTDALDSLLEFILADDTPVGPADAESLEFFRTATEDAKARLGKARLQRARDGAFVASMKPGVTSVGIENARILYERARAGDPTAGLTLAARFGDGSIDGDLESILEDLAELEAEENETH